jgi:hypothetical protein
MCVSAIMTEDASSVSVTSNEMLSGIVELLLPFVWLGAGIGGHAVVVVVVVRIRGGIVDFVVGRVLNCWTDNGNAAA